MPYPQPEIARQYRGLIHAWRSRPQWLRRPPAQGVHEFTARTPAGLRVAATRRYSIYSRIRLPTFGQITGKGAITRQRGTCRWCKTRIHENRRTLWHEACLSAYWCATGNQTALADRIRADVRAQNPPGIIACAHCGVDEQEARRQADLLKEQANTVHEQTWEALSQADTGPDRSALYARIRQLHEQSRHVSAFELDHQDALSVAWASGDERRLLRALCLANLQWLCHSCHAAKTGDDRRRMNNLLNGRPEDDPAPPGPPAPPLSPTPTRPACRSDRKARSLIPVPADIRLPRPARPRVPRHSRADPPEPS